jgi:SSS family solute:Na+ symporter/sodium/proline symporter
VSAIAAGTLITVTWDIPIVHAQLPPWLAARDAIFPALGAALFCLVFVSMVTKAPSAEALSRFHEPIPEPALPIEAEP